MYKTILLTALLAVTACAAPREGYNAYGEFTTNYNAANIHEAPDGSLCHQALKGPNPGIAHQEIKKRQLDCAPIYALMASQRVQTQQASQNMVNTGLQLQQLQIQQQIANQRSAPASTQCVNTPMGINCTSY